MSELTSISELGLTCENCGCGLRRLRRSACPGCGRRRIAAASIPLPQLPQWLGVLPAMLAVWMNVVVLAKCANMPAICKQYYGGGWCGTGLIDPSFMMMINVPFYVALVGIFWYLARREPFANILARCAFAIALGAWLITFVGFAVRT